MSENALAAADTRLAQIAKEIISAEGDYILAEERLIEAARNRQSALDNLGRLRSEIDVALEQLTTTPSNGAKPIGSVSTQDDVLSLDEEMSVQAKPPLIEPTFGRARP